MKARCADLIHVIRGFIFVLPFALALPALADTTATDREFAMLAATPYPAQHANPRNSDYTPYTSPINLKLKWKALEDSSIVQGCTTDRGQLYCARGWDKTTDKCNLIALSETDGSILWEDRVNGSCLLDEYASLTNPTVDTHGNLYINDSEKIVANIMSFIESNFLGRMGFDVRDGVWAWEPR